MQFSLSTSLPTNMQRPLQVSCFSVLKLEPLNKFNLNLLIIFSQLASSVTVTRLCLPVFLSNRKRQETFLQHSSNPDSNWFPQSELTSVHQPFISAFFIVFQDRFNAHVRIVSYQSLKYVHYFSKLISQRRKSHDCLPYNTHITQQMIIRVENNKLIQTNFNP